MKAPIILFLALFGFNLYAQEHAPEEGLASYYNDKYHGKATSSGEPYDMEAMTAAHRTYPFGTMIKVTRVDNGQSVIVKVNDRGPHSPEKVVDVSKKAALELDLIKLGKAAVKVEWVSGPKPVAAHSHDGPQSDTDGLGSYYNDKYHGKPTASGEPYDKDAMTAAHRTHPFGTMIKVTRQDNGKSVIVRVNDRGPHSAGYVVDVSRKAAEELGIVVIGKTMVKVEKLEEKPKEPEPSVLEEGIASYYHDKYQGKSTASGTPFDQNKMTAAHKTLPFGTNVKVTRLDNGKSVVVKVNDRGPYTTGYVIDLSKRAASQIDLLGVGKSMVKLELTQEEPNENAPTVAVKSDEKPKVVAPKPAEVKYEKGFTTYYKPKLFRKKLASGERYKRNEMTAAHRSLPFGTMVKVTRFDNGESIVVRINDRGPKKAGSVIELSKAAAKALGVWKVDDVTVKLEPVKGNKTEDAPKTVPTPSPIEAKPIEKPIEKTVENNVENKVVAPVTETLKPLEEKVESTITNITKPAAQEASKIGFGVQIATFSTEERAMTYIASLKKNWQEMAQIFPVPTNGVTKYKVIIVKFDDRETAQTNAESFKRSQAGASGFVVDLSTVK